MAAHSQPPGAGGGGRDEGLEQLIFEAAKVYLERKSVIADWKKGMLTRAQASAAVQPLGEKEKAMMAEAQKMGYNIEMFRDFVQQRALEIHRELEGLVNKAAANAIETEEVRRAFHRKETPAEEGDQKIRLLVDSSDRMYTRADALGVPPETFNTYVILRTREIMQERQKEVERKREIEEKRAEEERARKRAEYLKRAKEEVQRRLDEEYRERKESAKAREYDEEEKRRNAFKYRRFAEKVDGGPQEVGHWTRQYPCLPTHGDSIRGWHLPKSDGGDRILGMGTYGAVYKACKGEGDADCNYVIKKGDIEFREYELLKKAADIGVAKPLRDGWACVHGEMAPGGQYAIPNVIVTDYLEEPIWKHIRVLEVDTRKEDRALWALMRKVMRKLLRLHCEGHIMHNDIHGGNIMIDKEGEPFFIDFGIARSVYTTQGPSELYFDMCKIARDWRSLAQLYRCARKHSYLREYKILLNIPNAISNDFELPELFNENTQENGKEWLRKYGHLVTKDRLMEAEWRVVDAVLEMSQQELNFYYDEVIKMKDYRSGKPGEKTLLFHIASPEARYVASDLIKAIPPSADRPGHTSPGHYYVATGQRYEPPPF